jgi:hypothetical protein
VDSEKYLLTLDMSATINQYTIKRLVKFAYSLKQDEDWVITRVWEEFLREEKKHMTEELRETYFAEYQKFEPFIREQCKYLEAERVTIEFNSPTCIIDAPVDHLKARLIRRFTNKKPKA